MKDAASSPVKIKVIMESPDVGARTLGVNCQHWDQPFKPYIKQTFGCDPFISQKAVEHG